MRNHWRTFEGAIEHLMQPKEPLMNQWRTVIVLCNWHRERAEPSASALNRACVALCSQLDFDLLCCKRFFLIPSPPLCLLSSLDYWSKTSLLDARLHPRPIKTEFISLEWTINNISNIYVNLCVGEKLRLFDECLPRQGTHSDCDRIKRGTMNKINNTLILNLSCNWDSHFLNFI